MTQQMPPLMTANRAYYAVEAMNLACRGRRTGWNTLPEQPVDPEFHWAQTARHSRRGVPGKLAMTLIGVPAAAGLAVLIAEASLRFV